MSTHGEGSLKSMIEKKTEVPNWSTREPATGSYEENSICSKVYWNCNGKDSANKLRPRFNIFHNCLLNKLEDLFAEVQRSGPASRQCHGKRFSQQRGAHFSHQGQRNELCRQRYEGAQDVDGTQRL